MYVYKQSSDNRCSNGFYQIWISEEIGFTVIISIVIVVLEYRRINKSINVRNVKCSVYTPIVCDSFPVKTQSAVVKSTVAVVVPFRPYSENEYRNRRVFSFVFSFVCDRPAKRRENVAKAFRAWDGGVMNRVNCTYHLQLLASRSSSTRAKMRCLSREHKRGAGIRNAAANVEVFQRILPSTPYTQRYDAHTHAFASWPNVTGINETRRFAFIFFSENPRDFWCCHVKPRL